MAFLSDKIQQAGNGLSSFLLNAEQDLPPRKALRDFLLILAFSALVAVFCAKMVHLPQENRGWNPVMVQDWVENGFWKSAGLAFFKSKENPNDRYIYKTSAPYGMYPIYVFQKIIHSVRGKTSKGFWRFYNHAIWAVSGALVGFMALLMLKQCFMLERRYYLSLGFCASVLFLSNHAVYPNVIEITQEYLGVFMMLLISVVITYRNYKEAQDSRLLKRAPAVLMFCFVLVNKPMAVMYAVSIILFLFFTATDLKKARILEFLLPTLAGLVFVEVHFLLGQHFVDNVVGVVSSSFRFRTGLDGGYVHPEYLEFFKRASSGFRHRWLEYFTVASLAAVFCIIKGCRDSAMRAQFAVFLPLLMVGMLYFYVFTQGSMGHMRYFDILFVIPLTLAVYGWFCGYCIQFAKNKGGVFYIILIVSICFTMMHLRSIALMHPDPDVNWSSFATWLSR